MLAYQTVCYYGFKRMGVRDLEELSVDISRPVVLYYANIELLRYKNKTNHPISSNSHPSATAK